MIKSENGAGERMQPEVAQACHLDAVVGCQEPLHVQAALPKFACQPNVKTGT